MQLRKESSQANIIRAFEIGRVLIGESWHDGNLIVSAEHIVPDWRAEDPRELSLEDFGPALRLEPEIVLLGTGTNALLPDVDLMESFAQRAIGLEIMSTPAACRTYNVLVHEDRRVVAALMHDR